MHRTTIRNRIQEIHRFMNEFGLPEESADLFVSYSFHKEFSGIAETLINELSNELADDNRSQKTA